MTSDFQSDLEKHYRHDGDFEVQEVVNGENENADSESQGRASHSQSEAERFAATFLSKVARLRWVRIDRVKFLRSELHKRGVSRNMIDAAVTETPADAGVPMRLLDEIASASIDFETRKSTTLSFATGLPGGWAMAGTIPADITQFYVHAFRIMQKTAYLYGWKSFLDGVDEVDDETLGLLTSFLGVMMGVGGASASLGHFAVNVAGPAVQKKIAAIALTKTSWYIPMKQTLRIVGLHVTKQSFAKTVSKVVPVVGGVLSGGLTFVTLNAQGKRLQKYLRELPPPNVDAAEYKASMILEEEAADRDSRFSRIKSLASSVADQADEAVSQTSAFLRTRRKKNE